MKNKYYSDVIVVGGGHAGAEAASASARMGYKTTLITHKIEKIGEMSCNPAIGGLGKGHLVREIDALDGVMGKAIDSSGIQFRMLNTSRGAAVRGPRAQADRALYKKAIYNSLKKHKNLSFVEGSAEDVKIKNNKIQSVILENKKELSCSSLVLTTGTFLRGQIRVGNKSKSAGRVGDKPSINLAKKIQELKFSIGRLKTGTPPRILKKSINFSELEEQHADKIPTPFSFINKYIHIKQISCFVTHTNEKTHKIIKNNLHLSPMYSGTIKSMGARYCPSIEDKVSKFPNKTSHQIFLEPEGLESEIIYPNVLMIFHAQVITLGKSYTMPFYSGLKKGGIIIINSRTPIPFTPDEEKELEENGAQICYLPATEMANDLAKTELATNMAMCGAISGLFGLPDLKSLEESVKDRFIGKGIVVSGGTAALDSAIERKFAKKQKLLEANVRTLTAAFQYAIDQGWAAEAKKRRDAAKAMAGV